MLEVKDKLLRHVNRILSLLLHFMAVSFGYVRYDSWQYQSSCVAHMISSLARFWKL